MKSFTQQSDFYKVTCSLGWRVYVERFKEASNAQAFVKAVLGKDKPKWASETKIVAKAADTLQIESDRLEEVMETKGKGTLNEETQEKVQRFLFGAWKEKENTVYAKEVDHSQVKSSKVRPLLVGSKPSRLSEDAVTLRDICTRNKWDERRARQLLRKSGEQRSGRWVWDRDEVAGVEKKLKSLLK